MLGSVETFTSAYAKLNEWCRLSSSTIDPELSFGDRRIEGNELLDPITRIVGDALVNVFSEKMGSATYPFYVTVLMSLIHARAYVNLSMREAPMAILMHTTVLDGEFIDQYADFCSADVTHFFGEIAKGTYNQQHPACVIETKIYLGDEDGSGLDSTVFNCIMPMKPARDGEYLFPSYKEDPSKFKSIVRKMAPKVAEDCSNSKKKWLVVSSLIEDESPQYKATKLACLQNELDRGLLTQHEVWESSNNKRMMMIRACSGCGLRQFVLKKCGRCLKVSYCEVECQKKHWKTHKKTCIPHQ
jgi:hypothetical protein